MNGFQKKGRNLLINVPTSLTAPSTYSLTYPPIENLSTLVLPPYSTYIIQIQNFTLFLLA